MELLYKMSYDRIKVFDPEYIEKNKSNKEGEEMAHQAKKEKTTVDPLIICVVLVAVVLTSRFPFIITSLFNLIAKVVLWFL